MPNMGINWLPGACIKKKNRWLFRIPGVADDGVAMLPPQKAARPGLSFKETECQHLTETIYFPAKPDWKPVSVTLYDVRRNNPVFEWIKNVYDPEEGTWKPSAGGLGLGTQFKRRCELELYDGCGETLERWVFENAWPQNAEFGELEMSQSDVITCDLTLRYDRAFIQADLAL